MVAHSSRIGRARGRRIRRSGKDFPPNLASIEENSMFLGGKIEDFLQNSKNVPPNSLCALRESPDGIAIRNPCVRRIRADAGSCLFLPLRHSLNFGVLTILGGGEFG